MSLSRQRDIQYAYEQYTEWYDVITGIYVSEIRCDKHVALRLAAESDASRKDVHIEATLLEKLERTASGRRLMIDRIRSPRSAVTKLRRLTGGTVYGHYMISDICGTRRE